MIETAWAHFTSNGWLIFAAVAVAVLGVGRLTRVVVHDSFPPAAAARARWAKVTKGGSWNILLNCWWCFAPWAMALCLAWFFVGLLVLWVAIAWWIFWGWLGLSYLASMVIARDEPGE